MSKTENAEPPIRTVGDLRRYLSAHRDDALRNEMGLMGLLLCWIDIARKRGIDSADREMRDNLNGWTPSEGEPMTLICAECLKPASCDAVNPCLCALRCPDCEQEACTCDPPYYPPQTIQVPDETARV